MYQPNIMRIQSNYNIQKYNISKNNTVLIPNYMKKPQIIIKRHFSTFSQPDPPRPPPQDPKNILLFMMIIPAVSNYIFKKRFYKKDILSNSQK
jgi:hypothetical protein